MILNVVLSFAGGVEHDRFLLHAWGLLLLLLVLLGWLRLGIFILTPGKMRSRIVPLASSTDVAWVV